ncbi:hypothetical protein Msub_20214 [Marinobacter subterrani]|uniref:Uncharacterized protein n=1 Tax=Marinobacter subterrani TaxID=1658765 RepID=A0A0J7J3E5_9GAMM|nr:hypothetical protein Msub_20214 [Marinobacter subterrani]
MSGGSGGLFWSLLSLLVEGRSVGVGIFPLGKKNSLRSDTFFLSGKDTYPHAHRANS